MASASGIRMGGVFVEIGADPKKFFAALSRVNKGLANMGKQLVSGGTRMAAAGVGMAAPIVAAVRQGAAFESTLLNIRASTGATAGELDRIKAAAMGMSQALGVGPTAAAQGMLELLKAGMSLDSVLGGAGRTALEFAKVGEMDVAQAAVVMSDAMNVFGVSGSKAANTLSAAADASSTSIQQMAEAFSMSSAVAGLANQSIDALSAALAILANAGVKGSDAGTSVKTMLMRLMAPADDAAQAMAQIGLSVASFRGADGKMLPMVEIIGKLNAAMGGLDQAAKDDIFRRIFGADAIRAASILSAAGVDGFQGMLDSMSQALPVGEKYKILMSGLAGQFGVVVAALQRMAIAISDAVGPALAALTPFVTGLIDGLAKFVGENKEAVVVFAQVAAGVIGVGGAMVGLGYSLKALSGSISLILKGFGLFSALANPVLLVAAAIGAAVFGLYKFKDQIGAALGSVAPIVQEAAGAIGQGFTAAISDAGVVFGDLYKIASQALGGIYDAIAAGDLAGAMGIAWAGVEAVFLRGVEAVVSAWYTAVGEIKKAFVTVGSAWDTNVTKPIAMFGVRVAEASKERAVLGAFDTTQGTIFDNDSKKAARSRLKVAENLLSSSTVEGFAANRSAAETTIQSLQGVVDVGMGEGATDEQRKAGAAAAKEIEAFRSAIQIVQERFAQLGIKTAEERQAAIDQAKAEIDAVTQNNLGSIDLGAKEAQQRLTDLTSAAASKRSDVESLPAIQDALQTVQSLSELGKIGEQISGLMDRDTLTAEQEQKAIDAYNAAQQRLAADAQPTGDAAAQVAAAAGAAGEQSQVSMGSIAGTFSSLNLGAAFGGQTAADRTAKACEEIARNTRDMKGDRVAA